MNKFAENLRARRTALGLTQEALAEKLSGFGDVRVVGPGPGAHLLTDADEVPPADAATTAAGEGSRA